MLSGNYDTAVVAEIIAEAARNWQKQGLFGFLYLRPIPCGNVTDNAPVAIRNEIAKGLIHDEPTRGSLPVRYNVPMELG